MDNVVFNFHDQILILTAFECLIFVFFLWFGDTKPSLKNKLLAAFLLCHAIIPVHELIFWGTEFRHQMLAYSPNLFLIGNVGYYLDAVFLFFFILILRKYIKQKRAL